MGKRRVRIKEQASELTSGITGVDALIGGHLFLIFLPIGALIGLIVGPVLVALSVLFTAASGASKPIVGRRR